MLKILPDQPEPILLAQIFAKLNSLGHIYTEAMSSDKPFHVYANQTPGLVEQGYSATLLVENSVSGVVVKAVHEGESSTTPITEKWSHEAIVARSNMRPERMQKLKLAENSGQNPGLEFLHECWNDDPALQIVIKKLLAKFPQWGGCDCGWGADEVE